MKLQFFEVRTFGNKARPVEPVTIPEGSQFIKVKVLPIGIVAYYLVPELEGLSSVVDEYVIPRPDESIDTAKLEFIDILDTMVEKPMADKPDVMDIVAVVFPIFRIRK